MPAPFQTVRHPLLSVLQSAAAAVARETLHPLSAAAAHVAAARVDPARAYAPPAHVAVPNVACAQLGLAYLEAVARGDPAAIQAAHDRVKFSACDPLWAETLVEYAARLGRPIPYIAYATPGDFVLTAPAARLRIALFSDWGTGTATARAVAALMARLRPDIAIHLGDIYYAGTQEECAAHFLAPLRMAMPQVPLFTLCGNHDVYSGGEGYYGLLRTIGQPASYFCLRSPDSAWQILAGDTGYHDRDPLNEQTALTRLHEAELEWHLDKMRGFPGRTVFLTHHQPFSAYAQIGPAEAHDPVNPHLMAVAGALGAAGRLAAWFWGHEHRLRVYAPYRGLAAGRNIGYGAVPVEAVPDPIPLPGLADPPPLKATLRLDTVDGADSHGFALLDAAPEALRASYWQLTRPDAPLYEEAL